jgi:hypothetical protein
MELTPKQRKIHLLWAQGYNPIHLFGDVYLVRYESTVFSKIPFYTIKIIKD